MGDLKTSSLTSPQAVLQRDASEICETERGTRGRSKLGISDCMVLCDRAVFDCCLVAVVRQRAGCPGCVCVSVCVCMCVLLMRFITTLQAQDIWVHVALRSYLRCLACARAPP